jgi:CrcB protein
MIRDILLVAGGSALGGVARFLIGKGLTGLWATPLPLATLLVNISGSLLIGYIYSVYGKHGSLSPSALLFLATGICGGFTTFSAFSYENLLLIRSGQTTWAAFYILLSLVLGLLAVFAGYQIGK